MTTSEQERLDAFERGSCDHSTIEEAVDSYLEHRKNESELMESTVEVEKRRLRYLVDYCESRELRRRASCYPTTSTSIAPGVDLKRL